MAEYKLRISIDSDPLNPRVDFDNVTKMVCLHKRYTLGDEGHNLKSTDFNGWDELEEYLKSNEDAAIIEPLYLYSHSGITIRTSSFGCPWDSGQVGFVYMTNESLAKEFGGDREKGAKCLQAEVTMYDNYLTGEVYGFEVLKDDEVVDSCWGYFGDEEYARSEGEGALNAIREQDEAQEQAQYRETLSDTLVC